jgi:two-component system sensor histidine kinase RpfC
MVGTVLVVESDPDTRSRVESAITDAGNTVLLASSMRDAFVTISEGGIDVVVVDSYDPRVGVVELARSLETLPDAPPLVLISRSPHAPEISARIGAAAFIPKPIVAADLVEVVARLLGQVRPVRVVDAVDDDPSAPIRQIR